MITAVERFKMLLANALEQVCVLQEKLDSAYIRIDELEKEIEEFEKPHLPYTPPEEGMKDGGTEAADRAEAGPS